VRPAQRLRLRLVNTPYSRKNTAACDAPAPGSVPLVKDTLPNTVTAAIGSSPEPFVARKPHCLSMDLSGGVRRRRGRVRELVAHDQGVGWAVEDLIADIIHLIVGLLVSTELHGAQNLAVELADLRQ